MIVSLGDVTEVRNQPQNRISFPFFFFLIKDNRVISVVVWEGGGKTTWRDEHKTVQMCGSSTFINKGYELYRLERGWSGQHLLQHSRRSKPTGTISKGRQQLKAANLITKCKNVFRMGDSRKCLPGYLKTDRAEMLYK